ncbi:hypothetical protein DM02DRAFT_562028, partial [Periconia macrospinosa]
MPQLSLDDLDAHISNLRGALQFLNEALDATDHTAPDWLATDLVSLRNKSGRLQDEMQRFREQLEAEGLGVRTSAETKTSNKRLSIESAKHMSKTNKQPPSKSPRTSLNHTHPRSSPPPPQEHPSNDDYTPTHIDVTEEVRRRLHESRLRRLMGEPATSQKRKYDVFEDARMGEEGDGEEVVGEEEEGRNPFKRVRASGSF